MSHYDTKKVQIAMRERLGTILFLLAMIVLALLAILITRQVMI